MCTQIDNQLEMFEFSFKNFSINDILVKKKLILRYIKPKIIIFNKVKH